MRTTTATATSSCQSGRGEGGGPGTPAGGSRRYARPKDFAVHDVRQDGGERTCSEVEHELEGRLPAHEAEADGLAQDPADDQVPRTGEHKPQQQRYLAQAEQIRVTPVVERHRGQHRGRRQHDQDGGYADLGHRAARHRNVSDVVKRSADEQRD